MRIYSRLFVGLHSFLILSCNNLTKHSLIDDAGKKNLELQADQLAQAFIGGDYKTLVHFTHPAIVEKLGGPEKSIDYLKKQVTELNDQGVKFKTLKMGFPEKFVQAGTEIHTLIPETIYMTVPRGILKSDSYLIAVTKDRGKNWYFIDTASIDSSNVRQTLPNYNFELRIPKQKEPVLIDSR